MGNTKNNLSWSWPLISYVWLPEILGSFNYLIEPTWMGLNRHLTRTVNNKAFANRIVQQLKQLLIETSLVEKSGRFIKATIPPDRREIQKHLLNIIKTKPVSHTFFKKVSNTQSELNYNDLKTRPPKKWKGVGDYSVFKQWCLYYQFLGYGYLLNDHVFVPNSVISDETIKDHSFIEATMKAQKDPRYLTGVDSLHSGADFISWCKGEDNLILTEDNDIHPRIPLETILSTWKSENGPDSWQTALQSGIIKWEQDIQDQISQIISFDLDDMIFTWKTFIDYFAFGKPKHDDDHIDKNQFDVIRSKWGSIPQFNLTNTFWTSFRYLYKDITRLYWGITYYRNNLIRPIKRPFNFDEDILKIDYNKLSDLNLRGHRSKRTVQGIVRLCQFAYKSVKHLCDRNLHQTYANEYTKTKNELNNFLTKDPIERIEVLDRLQSILYLDEKSEHILTKNHNQPPHETPPNQSILNLFYWVHMYDELKTKPIVGVIQSIETQLDQLENKYIKEIKHFDRHSEAWNDSCRRLRDAIS